MNDSFILMRKLLFYKEKPRILHLVEVFLGGRGIYERFKEGISTYFERERERDYGNAMMFLAAIT